MISLETAFKQYGKGRMVNYIRDYFTDRISREMSVDKIIYVIDAYDYRERIEEHLDTFRNSPDFWNIKEN